MQVKLVYAQPIAMTLFSTTTDASGKQWSIDNVISGLTLSELNLRSAGFTPSTVNVESCQIEHGGRNVEVKKITNSGLALERLDTSQLTAIKPEDVRVGKLWAGLHSTHEPGKFLYKQDVLTITGADSAVMQPSQVAATWRLSDDALEVTLPGLNYRYRRLDPGSLGHERCLMEQRVAEQLLAVREIMAVPGADVNIDSSQLSR